MTTGVTIYLVSACTTGEEFVAAFRRYAERASLFVPIGEPVPTGRRGRFAVTLTGGGVMIEGEAEVISSAKSPSVLHGRIGMTLRFAELDDASKTVLAELEKARLVAKPSAPAVTPRVAELPATPRPKPPATSARVDAAATLAECVAIGNVDALEKSDKTPPKAGPKFVLPDVLPVGSPRPKTPSTPPELRAKTPTAPPNVTRAKTPSIPPVMPSLAPLPGSGGIPKPAPSTGSGGIPKPAPSSDSAKAVAAFIDGDPAADPAKRPPPKMSPGMKALSTMTLHGPGVPPSRPPTPPAGVSKADPAAGPISLAAGVSKADPAAGPISLAAGVSKADPKAPALPGSGAPASIMAAVQANTTPTQMAAVTPNPTPPSMAAVGSPTPTGMAVAGPPTIPTMTAPTPTPTPTGMAVAGPPTIPMTTPMPVPTPPPVTPAAKPSRAATWDGPTIPTPMNAAAAAVAALPPVKPPVHELLVADLDETTDLTSPPVALRPPSEQLPAVTPPKPVIEESTPSGDWTMVPGATGPTIEPRKPPPKRETGDWTIQLDSDSPDGWTEPAKVPKPPEPAAAPAPAPEKVVKRRPNQQENPPELAPVARSIEVDEKRFDDDDDPFAEEEPSIQVDPTLLQGVIVDPAKVDEMVAAARASSADLPRPTPVPELAAAPLPDPRMLAEGNPDPRRATPSPMGPPTPVPGTLIDPRATPLPLGMMPASAPVPGSDPRVTPLPPGMIAATPGDLRVTPLPVGIVPAGGPMPGTDPRGTPLPPGMVGALPATPIDPRLATPVPGAMVSPAQVAAMQVNPQARVLTDGGVGFFKETGEVGSLSGSYQSHDANDAKRRKRLLVIVISASLIVILGVVMVLLVGGGDKDDEAIATPPPPVVDAAAIDATLAVAPVVDAAEASVKVEVDAAVAPPPKAECFVDAASTPPGAEVVRDTTVLGTTPAKLALPCGEEVKLVVRKLKFTSQVRVVTPTAEGAPLRVALQKLMFSIKVSSQPAGANISLNGKSIAMTPTTLKVPAFELSTITFSKDGYTVESFKVTPKQNNQTVHAQLKRKR